jgi:acetyl esterase/lipase
MVILKWSELEILFYILILTTGKAKYNLLKHEDLSFSFNLVAIYGFKRSLFGIISLRGEMIKKAFQLLAILSTGAGILLSTRLRPPFGILMWILKVLTALFSPIVALSGFFSMLYGYLFKDLVSLVGGGAGLLLSGRHIQQVARTRPNFEPVFGANWEQKIPITQRVRMLSHPYSWRRTGRINGQLSSQMEANISFWSIPGTNRQLLCDVWQPAPGVPHTGAAILYFHSSAWCLVDKDFGTRPLFEYLARQGYVVMDVAYRLCKESGIEGMTQDVFRSVAWMKANAARYDIDPQRIILVGASAGGQIALLAAYARHEQAFIPTELVNRDLSVCGVASYYGPPDMRTVRAHNQILTGTAIRLLKRIGLGWQLSWIAARAFKWVTGQNYAPLREELYEFLQTEELIDRIMGGDPTQVPDRYHLVSPISYVRPGCPPTLLIHGEHDSLVPAYSTRDFYHRLQRAGVPVVYLELPQTDHGFDLILSPFSPSMQASLYALERFLAILLTSPKIQGSSLD